MQTRQTLLYSAIFLACGLGSQTQAALPVDPVLNFDPGVTTFTYSGTALVKSGSYFGMDTSGDGKIVAAERTALVVNNGLNISTSPSRNAYTIQPASGTHSGAPDGSETPGIDRAWNFFGNTGLHFTNAAAAVLSESGNTATLNFSGWNVTWSGIPAINMGTGAWATDGVTGFVNGIANLTCAVDCSIADTYTLDYRATVPLGDPSGFGGVSYTLHLVGTIGGFNTPPVTTSFTRGVLSTSAPIPGSSVTITLSTRTTDANGDVFTSTTPGISNPSANIATNCSPTAVVANNNGTVTFPACTNGTYTFDYTFTDLFETSNTSTVTVNASEEMVPNAEDDTATVDGITPYEIDVLANDIDNNIDPTTVVIVTPAVHGNTLVNATTGTITYTATSASYTGPDSFTYTVTDSATPTPQTSNVATVNVTVNATFPATSVGFAVGSTASASGSTTGIVTMTNIGIADNGSFPEDDIARSCIGGCFDFILSGITPGNSASIVLPLSTSIPAKLDPGNSIVYRKLMNGSWSTFDTTIDTYRSAPGTVTGSNISCPPATSTEYVGLTTGHNCLLLTITDGGPNDADGLADGTIVDPGGLAEITRVISTDGCSLTGNNNSKASDHAEWLLVAGFMSLLGWLGFSRRKA